MLHRRSPHLRPCVDVGSERDRAAADAAPAEHEVHEELVEGDEQEAAAARPAPSISASYKWFSREAFLRAAADLN